MSKVNGVLSRIGGQYIGGTADKLPPAQAGELPERQVVIDVPDLDAALEWAARAPCAATGGVEVRPAFTASAQGG